MSTLAVSQSSANSVRTLDARLELEPARRSADGVMRIRGTAIVYNSPSPKGALPFRETIKPGAFAACLADANTDLLLLVGHDRNRPLARQSAGNLTVRDTARGLEFEAELVDTTDGRDAYELLRKRVVRGCSFAFRTEPGGEQWSVRDGEEWVEVTKARIYELTLTAAPAYPQTDAEARSVVEAIRERRAAASDPYTGTRHSFFRDRYLEHRAMRQAREHRKTLEAMDVRQPLTGIPLEYVNYRPDPAARGSGGIPEALARLEKFRRGLVTRDVATGAFTGFVPTATPGRVSDRFATKARAAAALAAALRREPLPPDGMELSGTRLTTGASVSLVSTENAAPSETDPAGASVTSPIGMVTGVVDVSRQALERADAEFDLGLAAELGAALGAKLDEVLLSGSGTGLSPRGLINVSGITAVAYTDGTPTQAEAWARIMEALSTASTALGAMLDRVVLHSRRSAWFANWKDANGVLVRPEWPGELVLCNSIPTNLGAGTNEDYLLVLASDELPVFLDPPVIEFHDRPDVSPATVRVAATQYVGALFGRRPEAIAQMSGTGFVTPTFA